MKSPAPEELPQAPPAHSGGPSLVQAAQSRVSILGEIQELTGHGPGQTALGGPAGACRRADLQALTASTIL